MGLAHRGRLLRPAQEYVQIPRGRAGGVERASNIFEPTPNLRQTVVNRTNFNQLPLPSLQDNSSQLILRLPVEYQAVTRTPLQKQSYMGSLPTEIVDVIAVCCSTTFTKLIVYRTPNTISV